MKRHEISLGALSRHRALLYGFAAAWILLFHMHFQLPNHPALIPLQWFKASGNAGVEMFLLLSGFGLYGSMSRDGSVLVVLSPQVFEGVSAVLHRRGGVLRAGAH